MTKFLIRSARDVLVLSWLALMFGAYLVINEANRLGDAASISDEARYVMIGAAVVVGLVYTGICGASLVMFGVHDRLGEISDSLALVADKFCREEPARAMLSELSADPVESRKRGLTAALRSAH